MVSPVASQPTQASPSTCASRQQHHAKDTTLTDNALWRIAPTHHHLGSSAISSALVVARSDGRKARRRRLAALLLCDAAPSSSNRTGPQLLLSPTGAPMWTSAAHRQGPRDC